MTLEDNQSLGGILLQHTAARSVLIMSMLRGVEDVDTLQVKKDHQKLGGICLQHAAACSVLIMLTGFSSMLRGVEDVDLLQVREDHKRLGGFSRSHCMKMITLMKTPVPLQVKKDHQRLGGMLLQHGAARSVLIMLKGFSFMLMKA